MWSHCTVCSADLGTNPDVEHFPVGRRLAFDPDRGRLWVVCPSCERWSLTPLEQRWEALEELQRLWEVAQARVSGESIALGRLPSGARLIRVGPDSSDAEEVAWRWGRRSRRSTVPPGAIAGGAGLGLAGASALLLPPPVGVVVGAGVLLHALLLRTLVDQGLMSATGIADAGDYTRLRRQDFLNSGMAPADDELGWSIHLHRPVTLRKTQKLWGEVDEPSFVWVEFTGDEAVGVARRAFPLLNRGRAPWRRVSRALDLVARAGGPEAYLRSAAAEKPRWVRFRHYPREMRLALEVVLFQEEERRALRGELERLEAAWEQAEEIAAIADALLPPKGWKRFVERYRGAEAGGSKDDR